MRETTSQLPKLSSEVADVQLGDERLNRRLGGLIDRVAARPGDSFPKMLDGAELEAAYRFFGNERVTPDAILEPHFRATARRAQGLDHVLLLEDTTEFDFPGESQRQGLGRLLRPGQGFFGHFALAATVDRRPLGLLGLMTMFRLDKSPGRRKRHDQNTRGESARWRELAAAAENWLEAGTHAIHIMDREGDSYATLSEFADENRSFVIRSCHDRRLVDGEQKLWEKARTGAIIVEREVQLSERRPSEGPKSRRHPARRARTAKLGLARVTVDLPRPHTPVAADAQPTLTVGVIHVFEIDPPAGEPPVEWILLTDLPLETVADVEFVVDCYRARWLIEEYFKALKTGCQYEKRQLESSHSLLNALAVLAPVAWRLLLLRHLARNLPEAPAQQALTPTQLSVLKAVAKKPLPANPTVRDALLAVAKLGGHLKNNGEPGWIVIGRGFHDLLLMEMAWLAAKCDQS
jgi:hypothetical protein